MTRFNIASIRFNSMMVILHFQQLALLAGCLFTAPLMADTETQCTSNQLNLEQVIQDPNIAMRLEATQLGVVLYLEGREPGSQQFAKDFAIELMKQKNLVRAFSHDNGYGLTEK